MDNHCMHVSTSTEIPQPIVPTESENESQIEYYDKLTSALNILASGLKSFVEEILKEQFKDAWMDNIHHGEGHPPKLDDPYNLLATIDRRWHTFKNYFKCSQGMIQKLRNIRNYAVHHDPPVPFSPESVNHDIDLMLTLLKYAQHLPSSKKAMEKLNELKYSVSESPVEAASSDKSMTTKEQIRWVESKLAGSPNDWHLKVFSLILEIPPGYLMSYGELAKQTNRRFNLNIGPLNAAWLRKKLYEILGHETDIPIHRVASQGDAYSTKDHPHTQKVNREKRTSEGSYPSPKWYTR